MNPAPAARSIRDGLRSAVVQAMKQGDRPALAAYRTALAAIDNAESVPMDHSHRAGAIETSPVGVGRADAPRRLLTEQDMVEIVRREVADRCASAASLAETRPDHAERLRREASLLQRLVDQVTASGP